MSRSLLVTISEATFLRLAQDAKTTPVEKYVADIVTAEAGARNARDARLVAVHHRTADPPKAVATVFAARAKRVNWNAVDAALDRAGLLPGRGR